MNLTKIFEKFMLFVDNRPGFAAFLGLFLILAIVFLLFPLIQAIPISHNWLGIVAAYPNSVIPGKQYELTVRAVDENITFDVEESNKNLIITEIIPLGGPTYRQKIIFEVSSPGQGYFTSDFASLNVQVEEEKNNFKIIYSIPVKIRIDSFSLPLRLFASLLLSAPIMQIFLTLIKKSSWLPLTSTNK